MGGTPRSRLSAGILLFRRHGDGPDGVEVLLAHPGGPYWKQQEYGSWSVPKGIAEDGEDALERVAEREFAEETGFEVAAVAVRPSDPPLDLGEVQLKSGKVIRAWAVEGDLDPDQAHSNEFEIEWPPRSVLIFSSASPPTTSPAPRRCFAARRSTRWSG